MAEEASDLAAGIIYALESQQRPGARPRLDLAAENCWNYQEWAEVCIGGQLGRREQCPQALARPLEREHGVLHQMSHRLLLYSLCDCGIESGHVVDIIHDTPSARNE